MLFSVKYTENGTKPKSIKLVISENNLIIKDDILFIRNTDNCADEWEEIYIKDGTSIEIEPIMQKISIPIIKTI